MKKNDKEFLEKETHKIKKFYETSPESKKRQRVNYKRSIKETFDDYYNSRNRKLALGDAVLLVSTTLIPLIALIIIVGNLLSYVNVMQDKALQIAFLILIMVMVMSFRIPNISYSLRMIDGDEE